MAHLRFSCWMALVALPTVLSAVTPSPVRLQYKADQAVLQRSRVSVEMTQKKPDKPLVVSAYQEAEARLQLSESPREPPYQLVMTLNQLRVGLESDRKRIAFDSKSPQDSPLLAELDKVMGEPIQLTVGENLQIQSSSEEFQRLIQDLRLMGGFNLSNLFSEMVQQLFALTGKSLEVGQRYTRELKLGAHTGAPIELTYEVVGISPEEVRATVDGTIPASSIQLPQGALGAASPAAVLKVSGAIDGKVVWSRQNALVYRTKIDYVYRGMVFEGGHQWPFELRMSHADATRPQSP